jgi:predicted amidophosphoribosyltransferase
MNEELEKTLDEDQSNGICKHCDKPFVRIGKSDFCPKCGLKKSREKVLIKNTRNKIQSKIQNRGIENEMPKKSHNGVQRMNFSETIP